MTEKSIDTDFIKIFFTVAVGLAAVTGYSYAETYYSALGVSLGAVGLTEVDTVMRGVLLQQDPVVFGAMVGAALLVAFVGSYFKPIRPLFGNIALSVGIPVIAWMVVAVAESRAKNHARLVSTGDVGRALYCDLIPEPNLSEAFIELFTNTTKNGLVRIIVENKESLYVVLSSENLPQDVSGQSFWIPKSNFRHCRTISGV